MARSKFKASTLLSSSSVGATKWRTRSYRFNISRVTGDVKYTDVQRAWDHFKKDYTDPKYETFNGKCSKDRKF